ncbi:hypothetical protein A3K63_01315 [Candidatus Micrarchaeota archaeon RBG_16_49_10]|nr:MAG: hypothetical protein A3K63_01315 [Candidatus Micrarchaeota archaeon RBG_16_49_10]
MVDIFAQVIFALEELGFFNFFLPFLLTSAIFYGLLRKSRVFGEEQKNIAVNAVVALVAALMVWGYPIIAGFDIQSELSRFFTHAMFVTITLLVGLLLTSMILPADLPKQIQSLLKGSTAGAILIVGVIVAVVLFITSGFLKLIFGPLIVNLSPNVLYTIGGILLLFLPLLFIFGGGGSEKPAEKKKEEGV